MFPIPTRMFVTSGIGVHRHQLTAFEYPLRAADIEQQNLVSVSSILPDLNRRRPSKDAPCSVSSFEARGFTARTSE